MSTVCGVRISLQSVLGRVLGIVLSAAALALSAGCDAGDAGRDVRDTIDVRTIEIKLKALTSDACHSDPASREPWQCEKYVTQLANAANTIEAAADTGFPQLEEPGRRMTAAIADYRDAGCVQQSTAEKGECVAALEELADAVTAAKEALGS